MSVTEDFYNRALTEPEAITAADVHALLRAKEGRPPAPIREDVYLDFKSGKQVKDRDRHVASLRKDVAAFANSMGGVLVFGVQDRPAPGDGEVSGPWLLDPVEKKDLDRLSRQQVHRDLHTVVGLLQPQPTVSEPIAVEGGFVVLVAVRRMSAPIYIVNERRLEYPIRFDDSSIILPDYVVQDIVLRRKARAVVTVTAGRSVVDAPHRQYSGMGHVPTSGWFLTIDLAATNESLVHISEASGLFVYPTLVSAPPPSPIAREVVERLDRLGGRHISIQQAPVIIGSLNERQTDKVGPYQQFVARLANGGLAKRVDFTNITRAHELDPAHVAFAVLVLVAQDQSPLYFQLRVQLLQGAKPAITAVMDDRPLKVGFQRARTDQDLQQLLDDED